MKKIHEFMRPFLAIIFGALLFLSYLNDLSANGAALVMAIIWLVFAAFALTVGILSIVMGEKLSKKVREYFDLAIVAGDPILLFVEILLIVIGGGLNVFGWVVNIIGMAASIGFASLLLFAYFKKNITVINLTFLFAAIFALYLLITIIFTPGGNGRGIGNITLVELAINLAYVGLAFSVLSLIKPESRKAPIVKDAEVTEKEESAE